jgi:hypothetical protein
MHVIVRPEAEVRTTIEITDEHRAALLDLAARRGKKGFSAVVEEAIDLYLRRGAQGGGRNTSALRGSLDQGEARALRRGVAAARERWR